MKQNLMVPTQTKETHMPVVEVKYKGMYVASPALRLADGLICAGQDYPTIRAALEAKGAGANMTASDIKEALDSASEGFITDGGRFVGRGAALSMAVWSGQLARGASASPNELTPGDPVDYAACGGEGE
jgi:hypothetical protein